MGKRSLSERMLYPIGVVVSATVEPNSHLEKIEHPRVWYEARVAEIKQLEDDKEYLQRSVCGTNAELSKAWDKIDQLKEDAVAYQKRYSDMKFELRTARRKVEQLEVDLLACRKLAHSYIEAYEKLAFQEEKDVGS